VFGFGFLFKLEDSCIGHHLGERAVRGGMEGVAEEGAEAEGEEPDEEGEEALEGREQVGGGLAG
jgi:hypothetical protein